jgi:lipoprotein-releasing system permease protein
MGLELFIALRYLRAKRKGLFATVTTGIGVAGVTVGVAALITTLSVMNGFQSDIQKKVIGAQAHVNVYGVRSVQNLKQIEAALQEEPAVVAWAPFVLGQAILSYRGRSTGIVVKGIEPEREFKVNDLAKTLREGRWKDLTPLPGPKPTASNLGATKAQTSGKIRGAGGLGAKASKASALPGIVLGAELAHLVGTWAGQEVVLVSPQGLDIPLGMIPKMQRFNVAGLLHTGYYEYDSSTGWAELGTTARFFGVEPGATGLGVRLTDLHAADTVGRKLQKKLGPHHTVRTYNQINQTLFAALKLEKTVMFIILTLIILVASLNIASTLILRSVEKSRDIGLLKAMGASPAQIRRIFLTEGFLIGCAGLAMGLLLGLSLCYIIGHYQIVELPAEIYYLSEVPVSVQLRDILAVLGVGLALSLLATVYPASRAAKVDPVEAIHYG